MSSAESISSNQAPVDFTYFEETSHQAIDRISTLGANIYREFRNTKESHNSFDKFHFATKLALIPLSVMHSKTTSSCLKQALFIDGISRLNDFTTMDSFTNHTSVTNEALNGLVRTGTVFGTNIKQAGQAAIQNTVNELIFDENLSNKELIANHAALIGTGLAILPFAFNTAKNAFIVAEFTALGYELYQNKDAILNHPTVQATSQLLAQDIKHFFSSILESTKSNYEIGIKTFPTLSTENKILTTVSAVALLASSGYALTYTPSAISKLGSLSNKVLSTSKSLARAYLLFRGAEMLFGTEDNKKV